MPNKVKKNTVKTFYGVSYKGWRPQDGITIYPDIKMAMRDAYDDYDGDGGSVIIQFNSDGKKYKVKKEIEEIK